MQTLFSVPEKLMFSFRETENGKFIYRCQGPSDSIAHCPRRRAQRLSRRVSLVQRRRDYASAPYAGAVRQDIVRPCVLVR